MLATQTLQKSLELSQTQINILLLYQKNSIAKNVTENLFLDRGVGGNQQRHMGVGWACPSLILFFCTTGKSTFATKLLS